MKTMHQLIIAAVTLGLASFASAQSAMAPADQSAKPASTDPYIQRRNEKAAAKKEYKSKQISKDQYKQEKKAANTELKKSGVEAPIEGNIDINPVGAGTKK